jgi:hypothetical protein
MKLGSSGSRDLFPGALEMILHILRRQPLHGYALVQDIKRTSKDLLQVSRTPSIRRAVNSAT